MKNRAARLCALLLSLALLGAGPGAACAAQSGSEPGLVEVMFRDDLTVRLRGGGLAGLPAGTRDALSALLGGQPAARWERLSDVP